MFKNGYLFINCHWFGFTLLLSDSQVRTQGGALGAQKCPKEERKFRPDMSAKKNVHVPLRYDKIKTKKVEKKEENSKRKGLKLKK